MSEVTTQEIVPVEELAKAPSATVVKPTQKLTAKGKPDLRGTSELKINYTVDNLSVSVMARHHTLSATDVHEEMKRRIVWRDGQGKRCRYSTTPFRKGYFLVDENDPSSETLLLTKMDYPKTVHEALEAALKLTGEMHDRWPLVFMADDGAFYEPHETDPNTVQPYLLSEEGKEEAIAELEKTKEISINKDDLRPAVTYDQWLLERSKEIFAIGPDIPGLWKICEDMQRRDAVAVIQSFVERKGLTEYHMILKANHIAESGVFNLLGAVVTKPLQFTWLMPVPGTAEELAIRASGKKIRLLRGTI